jgi:hypothetical protein
MISVLVMLGSCLVEVSEAGPIDRDAAYALSRFSNRRSHLRCGSTSFVDLAMEECELSIRAVLGDMEDLAFGIRKFISPRNQSRRVAEQRASHRRSYEMERIGCHSKGKDAYDMAPVRMEFVSFTGAALQCAMQVKLEKSSSSSSAAAVLVKNEVQNIHNLAEDSLSGGVPCLARGAHVALSVPVGCIRLGRPVQTPDCAIAF